MSFGIYQVAALTEGGKLARALKGRQRELPDNKAHICYRLQLLVGWGSLWVN